MCLPGMGAIMTGLSVLSSVVQGVTGYMGQKQAADAQVKYQERQSAENARVINATAAAANQDYINKSFQENVRQRQEEIAANNERENVMLQSAQARARAKVDAGASNINISSSPSIKGLINDFSVQEGRGLQNINTQREFELQQSQLNKESYRAQAQSAVNSIPRFIPSPVAQPSLLGTVFQTGASIAGSLNSYYSNRYTGRSSSVVPTTRIGR